MSAEIIPFERAEVIIPPQSQTDAALAPVIHLIHIGNILMPHTSRVERALAWELGKTVTAYLKESFPLGYGLLTVSLNGRTLSAIEREHVLPRAGDYLVASPVMQGGSTWRTLAQVAVMAAAVTAGVFLGPEFVALGWAATATMGAAMAGVAAGLISVGGNMLINALMPLSPSNKIQTPSWAFEGPQTTASPGLVIPKGCGTFRSGGNIISSFVDIEGSNQYINALVCYGFGPARAISDIEINGKSIGTYQNVQVYTRLGSNDQTAIPAFNRVINGYPQQVQVTCAGGPVVVPGTGDLTQALQVDIMFPTGVYYVSGAGNNLPCKVVYKVEYAVNGSGVWQSILQPRTMQDVVIYHSDGTVNTTATPKWGLMWTGAAPGSGICLRTDNGPHTPGDQQSVTDTVTTYAADGTNATHSRTFAGEWQPINTALNQFRVIDWMDGWVQYVNDTTQAVYNRTSVYGLAPGKYDVRVTKYGSNNADNTVLIGDYDSPKRGQEVWIHSVNEITYQDLSYPNLILVGVRALATNQLSGASINVTANITYGLRSLDNGLMPAALQPFEEDNPALVAADMMLDPLYGGGQFPGITPVRIERFIDEWASWAQNCDALVPDGNGNSIRMCVFNGIFDAEMNLWEAVQAVGRISRAAVIPVGRDFGVMVYKQDTPVQMFNVGNILQDSFEETWLALDDRANQVEVEFADSTRYYRTDNPIVYMDPADQSAGAIVKNTRVKAFGVTVPAQAWHLGHFLGLCNKNILRTGKIQCDVEAVACRPGSLVILQHDVPEWGWGGRTLPGATANSVPVDRGDLPWDGVTAYNLIVLFPSIVRYNGTVTAAAASLDTTGNLVGYTCTLSSFDNANRVTRAVINGQDCAILSSSGGQVLVTPPFGFTPAVGQAYTLYDTDVLETATVANVTDGPNNTQILTLGMPFTAAPSDFSTYFYGQPGSQKIVRVSNIRRASEFRSVIEWIDETDAQYSVGTPVVGETSAQITTHPGVTDLAGVELVELDTAGNYLDYVSLSWKNGTNTAGVAIYGQYPGMQLPRLLDRVSGKKTHWRMQVSPGVAWTFTVVGYDAAEYYAEFTTAPSVSLTAVGVTPNLLKDSSFQSGFAYWNLTPRAGDTIAPTFQNDGEAQYTVAGATITAEQPILNQIIPASQWTVGVFLMLSAYFEVSGTPTGNLVAAIVFLDASGAEISTARAAVAMAGAAVALVRVNTAATAVPAGTAQVRVRWSVDGASLNVPSGSVLTASHLLLEIATSGQTTPRLWADIDASGKVLDVFQIGSSSSLRAQGSALPTYTGSFPFTYTDTSITPGWMDLEIQWPDSGLTEVMDGQLAITGLTPQTQYWLYLYFDIINGGVKTVAPAGAVGTPALAGPQQDAAADAACKQDGRIPLTPGGLPITTAATGQSGSGAGTGATGVFVTPGTPTMPNGSSTQQFSATVTIDGQPDSSGVTWMLGSGSYGTIDQTGLYTGPGSAYPHGGASILATSKRNPSVTGGTSVTW